MFIISKIFVFSNKITPVLFDGVPCFYRASIRRFKLHFASAATMVPFLVFMTHSVDNQGSVVTFVSCNVIKFCDKFSMAAIKSLQRVKYTKMLPGWEKILSYEVRSKYKY